MTQTKEKKAMTPANETKAASERFTQMIMAQYANIGDYAFTEREKQLIRNYFVAIDRALKNADDERLRKNANNSDSKYNNDLPYGWNTVDLETLAKDLAHYAHLGLDMLEDNTLFPIPYKDNKRGCYTVNLMPGYNGIRYEAEKYALVPFRSVTVEVIYENDVFTVYKKSRSNPVESYDFDVPQPFNRGKPIGVFGYIEYEDSAKNKLLTFSSSDVMKRKPEKASAEFWGGTKKVRGKDGKWTEVELEGWLPQMYEKTMYREAYSSKHIPRDPAKIDASYLYIRQREQSYADAMIDAEVIENGNGAPVSLPEPHPVELPVEEADPIPNQTMAELDDDLPPEADF